ncbi:aspartate aminotransferase family protein [Candidatus Lucifugimonas marina]|uniref:Aminotransferase class III-fold pyridoxal phosphate-dependent enzyme n=1 Tax=Candidatus Lucifugimonas marina TaxID=3038979 RepID=A0AAJ5ZGB9_9CHLR|nr:aminotransferase class III-fold pyridoxal phosphate-dependent enzyme [SAR202 cluster bacterium JH702]MDG0869326.1 aminotransferase class III-fold pyridoxal phosphate-dependent enzyme [SAR202 cluster bacterium JH639]WFG36725.1 aminotransferase class III-fold pyridoxal phosphate-dependent enzyme [SAR202 cluster bacterium JH545]WFG40659.1 aminotransferase class III-fold pyridoxal phosphate-dependent enzyme [SAR202 cluster bacterium JH1073]
MPQIPAANDPKALRQAVLEHMHMGMTNQTILAEEGGPLLMESAEGIYITDVEGNRYIDGISGMGFRNVGHGREEIAKAIYDQLNSVSMNVYSGATPKTIQLAAKLAEIAPGDLSRTFFCQGGSEANESALKMAQAYHVRRGDAGRHKIISRYGSYHGSTYGTMWLGGHPGFPRTDYQPKPSNVVTVGQPLYYHDTYGSNSPEQNGERAAQEIEKTILFEGPESVSAVIGEPVSQPFGGVVPPANYWPMVREICDKYGVLLIFDEVITGFGRLGTWFGSDLVKVVPDIMAFAKGITSGYFPVGGAISTQKIADAFAGGPEKVWSHMYTYSAHPGGAAAAFANLEIIERENLVENARIRGEQLTDSLEEMKAKHPIIGDVRGVGLLQGIEFVKDRKTKEHFDPSLGVSKMVTDELRKRGVWIRSSLFILLIAPPFNITADEMDDFTTRIDEAFGAVERRLGIAA